MKVLCSSEIIMRAHLSGLTLRAFRVKSCIKSSLSSEATGISPSRMWTILCHFFTPVQLSLSCSTEVKNLFVTRLLRFFFTVFLDFLRTLCMQVLSQCLKIAKKVALTIASEASYVFIMSGQKFIKNAKNSPFWWFFENLKLAVKQCYQTSHF